MPPLITSANLTGRPARALNRGRYEKPHQAYAFPKNFAWGASTAAAQIEGAAFEDGKGESIWDRLAETRKIDAPTVACDHYHRYREDAALLKTLGITNYRLSVSWPRIFAKGDGSVNVAGLDFYDRLIDELLANGVTPWVTLYHWDLPQALEDRGGWRVRSTAEAFGRYAAFVVQRLGDRVKNWMSLNEILRFVPAGYGSGQDAPGATEPPGVINQIYHHTLLAHGYAVDAVRQFGGRGARIGLAHNPPTPVPVTETKEDIEAARSEYIRGTEQLMGPLYFGAYPEAFLSGASAPAPKVERGDLELISQRTDFLGLNVYFGEFVRRGPDGRAEKMALPSQYPKADISWLSIVPQAMYWAVRHAHEAYGVKTLYITENGAPYLDRVLPNGEIHDLARREFLRNHLISLHRAIHEGFDVRGYFVWSLVDNYEWTEGYNRRFGIVHVDYKTLRRTPKLSGYWYSKVIESNAVI
jgi:beta-glucosidase